MSIRRPSNRAERRRAARRGRRRSALAALSAAASALPGLAGGAHAGSPVEEITSAFQTAYYVEDKLSPGSAVAGEDRDRYEIFTQQLSVRAPVFRRAEVSLDLGFETMSGASPWYVQPSATPGGDPIQVMSGATIEEQRTDFVLSTSYYFDRTKYTLSGGSSIENDYLSGSFGFGIEREVMDKNATWNLGFTYSTDSIEPTDADEFITRVDSASKESITLDFGISQILHRSAILKGSLSYKNSEGFLSDPYKMAFVGNGVRADARPSERNQVALMLRYRQHIAALAASLHLDYRFGIDDWDLTSHTFDLAWHQSLWDRFSLVPSLRYYTQSQAFFYAPFYDFARPDGFHSSDYRLAPYGAFRYGLRGNARVEDFPGELDWTLSLAYERYLSDGAFALVPVAVENPGLVSYQVLSFNVGTRF